METSRKKRFVSIIIDYFVIVGYTLLLLICSLILYLIFFNGNIPKLNEWQGNAVSFFTLLLPVFLYFVLTENSSKHATIGKRKVGLFVASVKGTLSLGQVLGRNFFKLLPWQIAHMAMFHVLGNDSQPTSYFYLCLVFVYLFPIVNLGCMIWRKDRRALHDLIVGAIVIAID